MTATSVLWLDRSAAKCSIAYGLYGAATLRTYSDGINWRLPGWTVDELHFRLLSLVDVHHVACCVLVDNVQRSIDYD